MAGWCEGVASRDDLMAGLLTYCNHNTYNADSLVQFRPISILNKPDSLPAALLLPARHISSFNAHPCRDAMRHPCGDVTFYDDLLK